MSIPYTLTMSFAEGTSGRSSFYIASDEYSPYDDP